jgi:hypothetical protein
MLKHKRGLNYQKAKKSEIKEQRCCWFCQAIVWIDIFGCAFGVTEPLRKDWRCRVVGIKMGRNYAININNLCDAFQKRQSGLPEGRE